MRETMNERVEKFGLKVDAVLANFIDNEAIPGTGIEKDIFWKGFTYLVSKLSKKNEHLLKFVIGEIIHLAYKTLGLLQPFTTGVYLIYDDF